MAHHSPRLITTRLRAQSLLCVALGVVVRGRP